MSAHVPMTTGLKPEVLASINSVFVRFPQVDRVVLYGSRAKGNYRPGSDIDLALEGDNLGLSELNTIASELDELLLPYTIDISIRHKIENTDLKEHIHRAGIVLYEKA